MSGFFPSTLERSIMRSSSGALSMLKQSIPVFSARSISDTDFPTPEKIIAWGAAPAAITLWSSPPETMSNPLPS